MITNGIVSEESKPKTKEHDALTVLGTVLVLALGMSVFGYMRLGKHGNYVAVALFVVIVILRLVLYLRGNRG
jgi:hypothetical protein